MCPFVYGYTYTYTYMGIHIHIHVYGAMVRIYAYECVHYFEHVNAYVCACVYHVHTYTCMCVHVYMNVDIVHMMCVVVCAHLCVRGLMSHVCVHAYVCVYIRINYNQTKQTPT